VPIEEQEDQIRYNTLQYFVVHQELTFYIKHFLLSICHHLKMKNMTNQNKEKWQKLQNKNKQKIKSRDSCSLKIIKMKSTFILTIFD
jgi:hypothetical protein